MTTKVKLERFHANKIVKASNDLEVVMELTSAGNWGKSINNLLEEWSEFHSLLNEISRESVSEIGFSAVQAHKEQASKVISVLSDEAVLPAELSEAAKSYNTAHEFTNKVKPIILKEYALTDEELRQVIESLDIAVNVVKNSPSEVLKDKSKHHLDLMFGLSSILDSELDIHELKLQLDTLGISKNPKLFIPKFIHQYEGARSLLLERKGWEDNFIFTRKDINNNYSDLSSNITVIEDVFNKAKELEDLSEDIGKLEVPFYSDIGIYGEELRYKILEHVNNAIFAVGRNPATDESLFEAKGYANEISSLLGKVIDDANYLYQKRADVQDFCDMSLEDVAVYQDSNTDWYITYFEEGTQEYDDAKRISKECITEANRLDRNLGSLTHLTNSLKHLMARFKDETFDAINQEKTLESSLER